MNAVKTFLVSLAVGAVTSAVTTLAIARITGRRPEPPCEAAGVRLPPVHCAAFTRLVVAGRERERALADALRRLDAIEQAHAVPAAPSTPDAATPTPSAMPAPSPAPAPAAATGPARRTAR